MDAEGEARARREGPDRQVVVVVVVVVVVGLIDRTGYGECVGCVVVRGMGGVCVL